MKKHVFMKRFVAILLSLTMVLSGSTTAFAKQDNDKDKGKDLVNLVITNIPENQTLTVGTRWDFEAVVDASGQAKGKVEKGITRWEIGKDTAGVGTISDDGVVTPKQAGSFQVRALYFQDDKKFSSWLDNKQKNEKFILGSSEWSTITVNPAKPKDNVPPTIYLNGDETINLNEGDSYIEQGATAWDNVDGDISNKIIISSKVNSSVPGTYQVTYNVSDAAGNAATQIIRTVVISDRTAPVITLKGDPIIYLTLGQNYLEPGFTANDNVDGDITAGVQSYGSVDVNSTGFFYFFYSVTDSSGNFGYAQRYVIISDKNVNAAPLIMMNGDNVTVQQIGSDYVEQGAIAYDDMDGNISDKIVISGTVNPNVEGIYYVNYDVKDSNGLNAQQVTRKVVFTDLNNPIDYIGPTIDLSGDYYMAINVGDTYVEPGYTAWDNVDGDVTDKVVVSSNLDTSVPGTYQITYDVTDAAGNPGNHLVRTIYVDSLESANINGDRVMFLTVGEEFTDPGVTVINEAGEDVSSQVIVEGTVDINTPGTYEIIYDNKHLFGGYYYDLRRTVIVSEADAVVAPIISLPYERVTIPAGPGNEEWLRNIYCAFDDKDGNITDRVIVGGDTVDFYTLGTYNVTFDVSDLDGNAAVQKTLTIIIRDPNAPVDMEAPVITLNGDPSIFLNVGDTFVEPDMTAFDNVDGDITSQIETWYSDVNMNVPGIYCQTFAVMDSSGNCGYASRYVVVSEPGTPVAPIFILSSVFDPQVVQIGSEYIPQIFQAFDDKDGNITDKVVIGGDVVDTNVEGVYHVTYNVQDSDGLSAYQFSIKVVVTDLNNPIDYTEPDLQLHGDTFMNINVGDTYVEPGYQAIDDRDGDVTSSVIVEGSVDTNQAGFYILTYKVKDRAGNEAVWNRYISVNRTDFIAPVITLNGDPVIYLTIGDTFVDPGATAFDNIDGDISDKIEINYSDVDTSKVGLYYYHSYSVTDSSGNTSYVGRYVVVSEPNASVEPTFYVENINEPYIVQIGTVYEGRNVRAFDKKDGEITDRIVISGDIVDPNVEGIYYVTYNVMDSDGLDAYPITLKVIVTDMNNPIDYIDPDLQIFGDYWMNINVGDTYIEPGYQAIDNKDGDLTGSVVVEGNVDTSVPGVYMLTYTVNDSTGNVSINHRYIQVNRTDFIAPVITLNGDPVIYLTVGDTYVDPGVTAIDNIDGDITDKVEVSNYGLDTSSAGYYFQYYQVRDSSGNYSYTSRHVIVMEPGANLCPYLSLANYSNPLLVQIGSTYENPDVIAYDEKEGNISDKVVFSGDVVDPNVEGIYYVTCFVQDSEGYGSGTQFKVVVTDLNNPLDYTDPELQLLGSTYDIINVGDTFTEPGYIATDDKDGDITGAVTVEGNVDTSVSGDYWLIYTVRDSAGNKAVQSRHVSVMPVANYPRTGLNGDYFMFLTVGDEFIDPGATIINAAGEDISSQVNVVGTVDMNTPGIYKIDYYFQINEYYLSLCRTVVVSEVGAVAPIILVGNSNITIPVGMGSETLLQGYLAYDKQEGYITDRVVIGGDTVDFNTPGTYVVTYNVSDIDGNAAEQQTFTVNVVDSY